jgi:hypothetical protein
VVLEKIKADTMVLEAGMRIEPHILRFIVRHVLSFCVCGASGLAPSASYGICIPNSVLDKYNLSRIS